MGLFQNFLNRKLGKKTYRVYFTMVLGDTSADRSVNVQAYNKRGAHKQAITWARENITFLVNNIQTTKS